MPTFGNISLELPGSGSEITSSFNVLPVVFGSPSYSRAAGTIGTLEAIITEYDATGSYGELFFRMPSSESRSTTGSKILTISATGSNDEPRVGIGFGESEKPIKSFEVKTKKDSTEGTELLLRSSRTSEGAQVGDLGGAIRFSIDSASFKDVTTSGSVALIDSIVTTVEPEGITGDLAFNVATSARLAPTEMVRLRGDNNRVDITGSLRVTSNITTDTLSNVETTLTDDAITNVDTFATATYRGAIYDYVLYDNTVGARAGQFMVVHDGGSITFTDTSTKHLTDSTVPSITADINGANVRVRVTNGNGYTFKALVKKL